MRECPRCHSRQVRFSEHTGGYVCASCGATIADASIDNSVSARCRKVRDYIRTEQMQCALNELNQLRREYPGNVEVQQLYLAAHTNNFRSPPTNRAEVERAYRVLGSMGGLTEDAGQYYYQMLGQNEEKVIREYNRIKNIVIALLVVSVLILLSDCDFLILIPIFIVFKYGIAEQFCSKRKALMDFYRNPRAF